MKIARIPLFISLLLALLSAMSHGLKLTELMLNPTNAVDPNTQWFEIYNPLDVVVELKGYRIRHCEQGDCSTYMLQSTRSMGPNEYVVIGNNGESATNGGIALYQLSFKRIRKEGFNMLAIMQPDFDVFEDTFYFSSLDRNFTDGVSLSRVSNLGPATSLANWKLSTTFINCVEGGDKGTPGKLNTYACPTKSPTTVPTKAPTKRPTKAPTKSPTKKPIEMKGPTIAPLKAPINAPVKSPTDAPNKAPANAPNKAPVSAAAAPIISPSGTTPNTSKKRCGLLGLRVVCFNGCGIFGRLLNMCQT
jgi:hypothetical protein